MSNEKPALGVSPHWFVLPKRMAELNECIGRQLASIDESETIEHNAQTLEFIARCAEELKTLSLLEARLRRMEGGE